MHIRLKGTEKLREIGNPQLLESSQSAGPAVHAPPSPGQAVPDAQILAPDSTVWHSLRTLKEGGGLGVGVQGSSACVCVVLLLEEARSQCDNRENSAEPSGAHTV